MEKKVGLVGFICPRTAEEVPFDYCLTHCPNPCMSIPLLVALMGDRNRKVIKGEYSVTEILNPPQIVYLSRNNPYFAHPDGLIWSTFGKAWHNLIEAQIPTLEKLGFKDCYRIENDNYFKIKLEETKYPAILKGRPDLYETHTKTLRDYKTLKVYPVKKMLKGDWGDSNHQMQLNIYRVYKYPEAKQMVIDAIIKDWSMSVQEREGIHPTEIIEVPLIADEIVKGKVIASIDLHMEVQKTGDYPPCEEKDLWIGQNPRSKTFGIPIRCRDYCSVKNLCQQYAQQKEGSEGEWYAEKPPKGQ